MEAIVANINAHDKNCYGCRRFDKPIMLTLSSDINDKTELYDFFMTTEQAERVISQLQKVISRNAPNTPEVDIRIPYMNS